MKKNTILLAILFITAISFSQTIIFTEDFESGGAEWGNENLGDGDTIWVFDTMVVSGDGTTNDFTTLAATFDDDAAGNDGQHDYMQLWHGPEDVSAYGNVTLTYDYSFNVNGTDNTQLLHVSLFDNTNGVWINIKTYGVDSNPTTDSIDVSAALIANPNIDPNNLFFGFGYDDLNGGWDWGAGIDNVSLIGINVQPTNDVFFRHIATSSNIISNFTLIDHPDLNNNPSATLLVVHNYSGTVDNNHDHIIGVFYNFSESKWSVFNEDFLEPMNINSEFNIYIAGENANTFTYRATQKNIVEDTFFNTSTISHPDLDNNPIAILFMNHYFNNSFQIYNDVKYAFAYFESNWQIWTEEFSENVVVDSEYKILIEPSANATTFRHTSNTANINTNYTFIDHPLLNNNPNATFIFSRINNIDGDDTTHNKNLGVLYNGLNWAIFNDDLSDMSENLIFNILMENDNTASVNDNELVNFNIYPNPVKDILTIDVSEEITQVKIIDLLGKEVQTTKSLINNSIDVSTLDTGIYFVKITIHNKEYSKKIIKE